MISVEEAEKRIASAFRVVGSENVDIDRACGRVLSDDAIALASQPPSAVSSMDGYAVRVDDVSSPGATLKVIGAAPAGHPFAGAVGRGQTVRIFTGGVIPAGTDAIVIQEDARSNGDLVQFSVAAIRQRHIRVAGLDFKQGDVIVPR